MTDLARIRNFCIIAHIDHGKSTLADRFLQLTGTVAERDMREQLLDTMDLERERGITIKANAVRLDYRAADGELYALNLIDTPGHVDFSYEVSRSLAAAEGALLVVDATQGIEAQTLANAYLAIESGLEVVPVVNKIDLPAAEPDRVTDQILGVIGGTADEVLRVSAKSGEGVDTLLEAIVTRLPAPTGELTGPLRALVFDSHYDTYRGVVCHVRVVDGAMTAGDQIEFMATGEPSTADEIGTLTPAPRPGKRLGTGEVGYLITGIKEIDLIRIGDTVTHDGRPAATPLPGYREPKPMVFSGLFPSEGDDFERLREALEKLRLNDSALVYQPETSRALGFRVPLRVPRSAPHGDRPGAAGTRVRPRSGGHRPLRRVPGHAHRWDGPPDPLTPGPAGAGTAGGGGGADRGGDDPHAHRIRGDGHGARAAAPGRDGGDELPRPGTGRAALQAAPRRDRVRLLRPAEVTDPGLRLARLRAEREQAADLVRVEILLNGIPVDAFSTIVHREKAYHYGRAMVDRLRELIPRQLFDVPVQAAIGTRVIARETIKAKRKDVLAKCYGGDVTRKRKLLEKQKEGKRRMKMVGNVEVPQEAFISALRINE